MATAIKIVATNDLAAINDLMRISKSYWGYDKTFVDLFMEHIGVTADYLQKNPIKLFYDNNTLIGFFSFSLNAGNAIELDYFFLHPDYIGKGFGKKLWDACCADAKAMQLKEFVIWSDPYAEEFYLKMGCEKIGVRQSFIMPNRFPPLLKSKLTN